MRMENKKKTLLLKMSISSRAVQEVCGVGGKKAAAMKTRIGGEAKTVRGGEQEESAARGKMCRKTRQ